MRIVGLPNRVISELGSNLIKHEYLLNFIYYTGENSDKEDLLIKDKVSASKLIDKNIFIGRRIPTKIEEVGAFVSIRVYNYAPQFRETGNFIKEVTVDINILVHDDCQKTIHGTRDLTIATAFQEVIQNNGLSGIADTCKIEGMYEILGLHPQFSGYKIRFKVTGFNQGIYSDGNN